MQINSNTPNIIRVTANNTQPTNNGAKMPNNNTPNITRGSTDSDITAAIAQGYGALVSWGYETGFAVTTTKIEEAFKAANVDITVPALTAAHATRTGCSSFRKQTYNGETYRAEVSHKDADAKEITISIQRQEKSGKKTNWVATETLVYDAANMAFKTVPSSDAAKYAVQCVNRRATYYTGLEFTRWVLKPLLLSNNAVKLADIDGLYYMIEPKMGLVRNIKAACGALTSIRFRKRSLIADSENIADMQEAAQESLQDRIGAVLDTLKTWEAKSKIRKSSETALYSELDEVQAEAEVLASALGFAATELTAAITSAKSRALEMITKKDDALGGEQASSDQTLNRWRAVLTDENVLAMTDDMEIYAVSVADAVAAGMAEATVTKGYYYRDGQIHARALAQLGYFGSVEEGEIIVQSL